MPVIKPSPFLTGLDFHNPKPGIYRASLYDVTRNTTGPGKLTMRWVWKLLSHPDPHNNYFGFRVYPLNNPGFLSQTLWSWLGYGWSDLAAQEADERPRPERLIGQGADILVVAQGTYAYANVARVWPAGRYVLQAADGTYSHHPKAQEEYEILVRLRSAES